MTPSSEMNSVTASFPMCCSSLCLSLIEPRFYSDVEPATAKSTPLQLRTHPPKGLDLFCEVDYCRPLVSIQTLPGERFVDPGRFGRRADNDRASPSTLRRSADRQEHRRPTVPRAVADRGHHHDLLRRGGTAFPSRPQWS